MVVFGNLSFKELFRSDVDVFSLVFSGFLYYSELRIMFFFLLMFYWRVMGFFFNFFFSIYI